MITRDTNDKKPLHCRTVLWIILVSDIGLLSQGPKVNDISDRSLFLARVSYNPTRKSTHA